MNKVIDYNYYLNLSNQLLLNYFRWSHDNNVFFFNFGTLHNFGKDESKALQIWYTNWSWQVLIDRW